MSLLGSAALLLLVAVTSAGCADSKELPLKHEATGSAACHLAINTWPFTLDPKPPNGETRFDSAVKYLERCGPERLVDEVRERDAWHRFRVEPGDEDGVRQAACDYTGTAVKWCEDLDTKVVRVRYSVHYVKEQESDRATVRYLEPSGEEVVVEVMLPWASETLEFSFDGDVRVSASAPAHGTSLICNVETDQGPYGRTASTGGTSNCETARKLRELGNRSFVRDD